jgi:cell wall-associated NlpC family hydrolase
VFWFAILGLSVIQSPTNAQEADMNNQTNKWYKKLIIAAMTLTIGFTGAVASNPSTAEAAVSSTARADNIINFGDNYLGRPYHFGAAANQTRNFDCSSFTQYVFKKNGINLPRTSKQQAKAGHFVPRSQLKKGDLVFFSVPGKPGVINHVAIYAGNGYILHTFGAGGVRFTKLSLHSWSSRYITARRVL